MTVTPKKIHIPGQCLPKSGIVIALDPPHAAVEDRDLESGVCGERPK
jgi:hypothetical protein